MSQRHLIANIDRREYLDPDRFGLPLRLADWSFTGGSILQALALLLAADNGGHGGDLHVDAQSPDRALVGSWAGKRVIVAGDDGPPGTWLSGETRADTFAGDRQRNLYAHARTAFTDISDRVIALLRSTDPDHPLHELELHTANRFVKSGYTPEEWGQEVRAIEHAREAMVKNDEADLVAALTDLKAVWMAQEARYAGDPAATRRRVPDRTPRERASGEAGKFRDQLRARLEAARAAKRAEPAPAPPAEPLKAGDRVVTRRDLVVNEGSDVPWGHWIRKIKPGTFGYLTRVHAPAECDDVCWWFTADDGRKATGRYPLDGAFARAAPPAPSGIALGDTVVLTRSLTASDQTMVPAGLCAVVMGIEDNPFQYELRTYDGRRVRYVMANLLRVATALEIAACVAHNLADPPVPGDGADWCHQDDGADDDDRPL